MRTAKVFPVILSGGSGSRLWPLSRESFPKQLLPLRNIYKPGGMRERAFAYISVGRA